MYAPGLEPHIFHLAAPEVQSLHMQGVTILFPISLKTARAANVTFLSILPLSFPLTPQILARPDPHPWDQRFQLWLHHWHTLSMFCLSCYHPHYKPGISHCRDLSHSRNPICSTSHLGPAVFRSKSNCLGSLSTNHKPSINHIHADHG